MNSHTGSSKRGIVSLEQYDMKVGTRDPCKTRPVTWITKILIHGFPSLQRSEAASVPVQSKLALEWREWLTVRLTTEYFADRSFYQVQAGSLLDNPDQRISSDIRCLTLLHPKPYDFIISNETLPSN